MNVLFHTTAAIGIIALSVSNKSKNESIFSKTQVVQGILFFSAGVLSHGVLDLTPHCYPINSKIDAIFSFAIILSLIFYSNKGNKLLVTSILFGCVFPDLIDLSPQIIENYLGIKMPSYDKIFPWHFHQYSGSIYNKSCFLSSFYHGLLITFVCLFVWAKRKSLMDVFYHKN